MRMSKVRGGFSRCDGNVSAVQDSSPTAERVCGQWHIVTSAVRDGASPGEFLRDQNGHLGGMKYQCRRGLLRGVSAIHSRLLSAHTHQ
ncbi:agmatinase 1 [Colletotrichum scovillei]|uniref:Agmatinase 1 n=1 Tax=Colletotrichum scovillei TaxID=1209932 RepID=A0A9P7UGR3_9PEZI|nr:agmatinase 1 [Colletotrichum scovillei]KAG7074567.1 agmatinase 1 [Colletotrichum scovillei]KAG7081688.1 agmatinase 1 [Colletotrichum scovillei]